MAEIQKRVLLARKINDQEHKTQKTKYDRSWMVKTAEDADIMYSGEESEDEEIKIQDHSKLRNQKVVLKQMLSIQLLPSRVKKSFYSGAEGAIDSILKL